MGAALPLGDPAPADGSLPAGTVIDPAVPFGAYLHIPFCRVRCGYCDFNTYTATELRGARQDDYAETLLREVTLARRVLSETGPLRPVETVFFGGGTPTLLPADDLVRMLDGVRSAFPGATDVEVTVEANPDTVDAAVAHRLAGAGVTRLSIGMQSAVPHVLATLDRSHRSDAVATAVTAAREAGLGVSIDLIYGAPGESLADWRASLETAIALDPDHLSAYALIVEEGTALARRIRRGELALPDDDLQAEMYELADDLLTAAGLSWYEVSNWARTPADRCRHNAAYWGGSDWWGFGPGAHGHIAGTRFWNVRHPAAYARRLEEGLSPAAGREVLSPSSRQLEAVLLGVRTRDGLAASSLPSGAGASLAALVADGLVEPRTADRVRLTRRGRLLADRVVRTLTA
ncbi:oxygen-independent coproporphyrinogen-3 oxidase [Microbacterium sp. AK009]|uniref:radical SAM family heme chaperone HemW n=1 Tax=Microbacterium sp. AK009 TaxID=2723068 RepID=UPI0015CE8DA7|nr:radical SAM family heme chaperone HemW [Microbacterium sp. AK009]NYF17056.1 oxygen-independent coproporphyrinogen-3 oxidase [Microbacterium sp. AK009]